MFEIVIDYFDPRRNRKAKITLMHPFFYPELGWKKSDEQRKECERLYQEMRAIEARRQPTA
jgi:hypothetical protein